MYFPENTKISPDLTPKFNLNDFVPFYYQVQQVLVETAKMYRLTIDNVIIIINLSKSLTFGNNRIAHAWKR